MRKSRIRTSLAVMALTVASTEAFVVTKRQRTDMSSARYYRTTDAGFGVQHQPMAANLQVSNPLHKTTATELPTWLRKQKSHLLERKLEDLKQAMINALFTEQEALKLQFALDEASRGNRNIMAGAAEFCLILVETMEMGLSSLIASAFHYASCVAAREAGGAWEYRQHESVSTFGEHAVEITRDAARLKKLEMVFSGIVQAESPTLDSNDADNLRNLLLTESRDWRALAIRSAACLYRLRGIGFPDKLTSEAVRASREALKIFAPLASRLGMHRLKNELEEAAFRTLYRRQYETVKSLSQQMRYKKLSQFNRRDTGTLNIGESLKCVLESVKHDMEQVLNNDPVFSHSVESFTVAARVKEPYSLWKKMLRYGSDSVLQVPDALALRIVLNAKKATPEEPDEVTSARDRALCYYAQQLCTQHWAPLEKNPRFKDYIEHPKPNGYQSLHYTANTEWEGEDWTMEIQIRSGEMNQVAEYGLASHWDYKAKNKNSDYSSDSYLRSVQEWHWQQRQASLVQLDLPPEPVLWDQQEQERAERIRARTQRLEPYIKALNEAQLDLARDHVFVFMTNASSGNSIIALPSGACVLDALREHERQSGVSLDHRGRVPTVNGLSSNLTQQLRNGDILTVSMPVVSVTV